MLWIMHGQHLLLAISLLGVVLVSLMPEIWSFATNSPTMLEKNSGDKNRSIQIPFLQHNFTIRFSFDYVLITPELSSDSSDLFRRKK